VPAVQPRDDDELLAELSAALAEAGVPQEVRLAGRAAWIWREIESDLAALAYDSADDGDLATLTRSAATPRTRVYRRGGLSVELEVSGREVAGQLLPPAAGEVEVVRPDGTTERTSVDEAGRFLLPEAPAGIVRLRCRTAAGGLATGWVHLLD
jgi:hypothetical protein